MEERSRIRLGLPIYDPQGIPAPAQWPFLQMKSIIQVRREVYDLPLALSGSQGRNRLVRILFVQHDLTKVEGYIQELTNVGFQVSADVVQTPRQLVAKLTIQLYDLLVAEYPCSDWGGVKASELLHQSSQVIPLIFVTHSLPREKIAELITQGAYDCVEEDHIGHLPVAMRRALDEGNLRGQRDRAEKMLKHSEAKYRALIGNLTYGICRCGLDGRFLEVNQALMTMLGYASREKLLVNLASDLILDPLTRARLFGKSSEKDRINPYETEWIGNGGEPLRVRVTGREVSGERGSPESYELIVEDVTKQRALEDHLRLQATRDALTGLANYRQLVDVLSTEIKRSKRTEREFALLLLDLDGLKKINDRYGHLVGSKALCRLADALCVCSRDIDTAARFGGDEFALVLPETGTVAAAVVAQRIRHCLANDAKDPKISVSVGGAIYPKNGKNVETLLGMADRALYEVKDARMTSR